MKFIIEHLEPEVFDWCLLEYVHISERIGKENLIFTNVNDERLKDFGEVRSESVNGMELQNPCILDPFAKKTLEPGEKFDYMVLGGILGDEPMQKRTEKEVQLKGERRNLGPDQMSTDTAAIVAKIILEGTKLEDIPVVDDIEIQIDEGESIILPFRYLEVAGKPILPKGLVEFLRKNPF